MNISIKKDGKLIKQVTLQNQPLIVGRSTSADIQLLDATISRQHLKITNNNLSVTFEDLGSRNGIFFKGSKVRSKEIFPGQNVRVGIYIISVDALDPSEQKTIAMLEEGEEAKTEVAYTLDDVDMVDELTLDAPPIEISNPLLHADVVMPENDEDLHKASTNKSKTNNADSFMQAIAVSQPPHSLPDIEDMHDSKTHLDTQEESFAFENSNPSFASIEDAPMANLDQEDTSENIHPSNLSKKNIRETREDKNLEEDEKSFFDNGIATKKINSDEIVSSPVIENSNPLFSEVLKEENKEDEKTPSIAFSSLQSSPQIKSDDSPRDIFQNNHPEDQESNIETGAFTPPTPSSSRTQIRNFERVPSPAPSKTLSTAKKYMFVLSAILIAALMLFWIKMFNAPSFAKKPKHLLPKI
ncbi:MAG: FHA domain-containing protein [Bdellovibrionota bacterium]